MTIGLVLVAGVALAGCSDAPTESESVSPSPTASAQPSSASGAETDEELLPMSVDEIDDWAKTAVPGSDAEGYEFGFSGWLGERTSANGATRFTSLEPGSYQAQLACRGDGTITLTGGDIDVEATTDPIVCSNETIAFDVTTVATGVQFDLALEGDPAIYAVSVIRPS